MTATMTPDLFGDAELVSVLDTDDMPREEWLDLRRGGIGGSDAAAIAGLNPRKSAFEVWLDKTAAPGYEDRGDSEAAMWGRVLEPVVAEQASLREGVAITAAKRLLRSRDRDWQLANLDGAVHHPALGLGVYEGKTAGHWTGQEWDDGNVPDAYLLQGMHYLAVTGHPYVLFGVLIAGQRLETRLVHRDEELIAHLNHLEGEFWARVQEGRPPAPDGSANCTDLLQHLWDVRPEAIVRMDPADVVPLLDAYRVAHAAEKAAKDAKATAGNQLKALLGDAEIAVDDADRKLFTWKQHRPRKFDQTAFAEAHPDLFETFKREAPERRLYVPKEGKR